MEKERDEKRDESVARRIIKLADGSSNGARNSAEIFVIRLPNHFQRAIRFRLKLFFFFLKNVQWKEETCHHPPASSWRSERRRRSGDLGQVLEEVWKFEEIMRCRGEYRHPVSIKDTLCLFFSLSLSLWEIQKFGRYLMPGRASGRLLTRG